MAGDGMCTERDFMLHIMREMASNEVKLDKELMELARKKNILKDNDVKSLNKILTREKAALYLYRADRVLHDMEKLNEKVTYLKEKKRISDLKDVKKENRATVIKVFWKGIMVGDSNGKYSSSRAFKPKSKVTKKEAEVYVKRLFHVKQRKKMSPDGQLIRTNSLPKNAKRYPYILESFPNEYYEPKFLFEKIKYGKKPVYLKDYAYPKDIGKMKFAYNQLTMENSMELYLDQWCQTVQRNMELRFNVNYRRIDKSWVNQLRNTYYVFEDDASANIRQTEDIKKYVKRMKENKVVIKLGKVAVERSSLYNAGEDYIRVYVKYKVESCKDVKGTLVYCDVFSGKKVVKGKWVEDWFDVGIGSRNGFSSGYDYKVSNNRLVSTNI